MKKALIFGISGQDGAYLAKLLLEKGYTVFGASRDAELSPFSKLTRMGIRDSIQTLSANPADFRSVLTALKRSQAGEVYNLAGQSSVGLSFDQPVDTFNSIAIANLNLLEAIRFLGTDVRYYNAGSSECFGNTPIPATEETPFRPRSPYAAAKAAAFFQTANYREAYGLYACSGILFNHESPLRPDRFVTQKIVRTACRIAKGSKDPLILGNTSIVRDWGWAPEYVEAMWLMLQQDRADDYIIATGTSCSLLDFTAQVFTELKLDYMEHLQSDASLLRPTDIVESRAAPYKAHARLGWAAATNMPDMVKKLVKEAQSEMFCD